MTGLTFSPQAIWLKFPSPFTNLLSCISIHQVRHHGYLSVQQWWQFQRDLVVGHHHCDVHSWRTSLNWLPAKEPSLLKKNSGLQKVTCNNNVRALSWSQLKFRLFFNGVVLLCQVRGRLKHKEEPELEDHRLECPTSLANTSSQVFTLLFGYKF